jgi:hypothetical protein
MKGAANPEVSTQLQGWAVECDSKADRMQKITRPGDLLEDARRSFLRADEYRAVADQMQDPTSRASNRYMAETYEARARALERLARRPKRGDQEQEKARSKM